MTIEKLAIFIVELAVFVVLYLIYKYKWKFNVFIGWAGEMFVRSKFRKLDRAKYKILNNILLPSLGKTSTTQIDHIVVSNFGIFCIETKSHLGWVFGKANEEYWTLVLFRFKKRLYNPLRQNFSHTKAVESLLESLLKAPIYSLVAFPYAEIKKMDTNQVGRARDVLNFINNIKNTVYTDNERDEIYTLLINANIKGRKARKQHIKEVRTLQK